MRALGVLDAALHRGEGAQVVDHAHACHGLADRGRIAQIGFHNLRTRTNPIKIGTQPGAEIVEHAHAFALGR